MKQITQEDIDDVIAELTSKRKEFESLGLTDLEKSEDDKRGIDTKGNEYTIELMEDNSMDKLNIDNYSLSLNE